MGNSMHSYNTFCSSLTNQISNILLLFTVVCITLVAYADVCSIFTFMAYSYVAM